MPGIDYSKWDLVEDSDDEDEPAKAGLEVTEHTNPDSELCSTRVQQINVLSSSGEQLATVEVDDSYTGAMVRSAVESKLDSSVRVKGLFAKGHEIEDSDHLSELELESPIELTAVLNKRYLCFTGSGPTMIVKNISDHTVSLQEVGSQFESDPMALTPGEQAEMRTDTDHKGRELLFTEDGWSTNVMFAPARRDWMINVSAESKAADEQWILTVSERDQRGIPLALSATDVTKSTLDVPEKSLYMGGGTVRIF